MVTHMTPKKLKKITASVEIVDASFVRNRQGHPSIKYTMFDLANGVKYLAYSNANWLKDTPMRQTVEITANVVKESDGVVIISKPTPVY